MITCKNVMEMFPFTSPNTTHTDMLVVLLPPHFPPYPFQTEGFRSPFLALTIHYRANFFRTNFRSFIGTFSLCFKFTLECVSGRVVNSPRPWESKKKSNHQVQWLSAELNGIGVGGRGSGYILKNGCAGGRATTVGGKREDTGQEVCEKGNG